MILGDWLDRIGRVQRARWFKIGASAVVVVIAVAVVISYIVRLQAERKDTLYRTEINASAPQFEPPPENASEEEKANYEQYIKVRDAQRTAVEATTRALNRMLSSQTDPSAVAVGAAAVTGLVLGVIWLGQGLYALLIAAGVASVAWPLIRFGGATARDAGKFIAALGALTMSFVVLMELLRLALSGPRPVIAIARNVVNEAVRIKVSLVFIVLLLFALASLPGLLDASTPLRYRVQSFLQYGTGGTFWIIAILTLFLAVSSVAFEQRDRVIWQTMTKPVAAWEYILGKWLGVVGVAAVLLAVSGTGVFLFTGYLRDQRAVGEVAPYRPADETGQVLITPDRLVLESQVLTSRVAVRPDAPELDPEEIRKELERRVAAARSADKDFRDSSEARAKLLREYEDEERKQASSIGGGQSKEFVFRGLKGVKTDGSPLTLRYKVDIGANDPKAVHRLTFALDNANPVIQEVPLGQVMTIDISPASIDSDGNLRVRVLNGDFARYNSGDPEWANEQTMSFPPDGFEVFYPVGSYHANFFRVVIVLWLKLAFLAMVAVTAATFLSFSVASLLAFGTFLMAESAKYLFDSLEYYASADDKGNIDVFRVLVRAIAVPVSRMFHYYSTLRPTAALVDGRLMAWTNVLTAVGILGLLTLALYAVAVTVFRRRELATYSGQ